MLTLGPRSFPRRQEAIAFSILLGVCVITTMPFRARAQAKPNIAGDYSGTLGPLHLNLYVKVDTAGMSLVLSTAPIRARMASLAPTSISMDTP